MRKTLNEKKIGELCVVPRVVVNKVSCGSLLRVRNSTKKEDLT